MNTLHSAVCEMQKNGSGGDSATLTRLESIRLEAVAVLDRLQRAG